MLTLLWKIFGNRDSLLPKLGRLTENIEFFVTANFTSAIFGRFYSFYAGIKPAPALGLLFSDSLWGLGRRWVLRQTPKLEDS